MPARATRRGSPSGNGSSFIPTFVSNEKKKSVEEEEHLKNKTRTTRRAERNTNPNPFVSRRGNEERAFGPPTARQKLRGWRFWQPWILVFRPVQTSPSFQIRGDGSRTDTPVHRKASRDDVNVHALQVFLLWLDEATCEGSD